MPRVAFEERTRLSRTQFPIAAGFVLTVNKAQGLTIKEGGVVHLDGSSRFRPASKRGLPIVAFTRSDGFAMTAFKNLQPWGDFLTGNECGWISLATSSECTAHARKSQCLDDLRTRAGGQIGHHLCG